MGEGELLAYDLIQFGALITVLSNMKAAPGQALF